MKKTLLIVTSLLSEESTATSALISAADHVALTQNGIYNKATFFTDRHEGISVAVVEGEEEGRYFGNGAPVITRRELVSLIEECERVVTL